MASHSTSSPPSSAAAVTAPAPEFMSLTVVGSGASTAVPVIGHIHTHCACRDAIAHPNGRNRRGNVSLLITTPAALRVAPDSSNNNNTGSGNADGKSSHAKFVGATQNTIHGKPVNFTLIDCGKTFRDAYFGVLVKHQVQLIDTLLLTHGHADAIAGLDDLRDLQPMHMMENGDWAIGRFIPTYLHAATLEVLRSQVGYIVRNSHVVGPAQATADAHAAQMRAHIEALKKEKGEDRWAVIGVRRSTALQFFTVPDDAIAPIHIPALSSRASNGGEGGDADGAAADTVPFYTIPFEHGKGYVSLGYAFGRGTAFRSAGGAAEGKADAAAERAALEGKSCVVYVSDVSATPAPALAFLQSLVKIDVLFVDCLLGPGASSPVHYCVDDAIAFVAQVKPRRAFAVGMYCDMTSDDGQAYLSQKMEQLVVDGVLKAGEVESFELAYDGMELVLPQ